ncbi:hypothetical protein A6P39_002955 [Streptomyces sp. FXJ1.172]|uniref:hypothetical protein n=1 Tax=Streptomyces sp. FXJ1.172 TaxID=710705 RepID=UPI0013317C06|nr:hypothetical protein [Streptomyces sp. FXJ1.172]WEO93110.1 hypothetical protein A6P39_002955 [Streptomyces sp. FXJ1.172]
MREKTQQVREIMTTGIVTVGLMTSVVDVAQLMRRGTSATCWWSTRAGCAEW